MMKSRRKIDPDEIKLSDLEKELKRVKYNSRYYQVLKSTVFTLVTVAALAILVVTMFLPVLRIVGVSMTPTLEEGQIVLSLKGSSFETGDIVAFYYNNKMLVKRVIASSGQWVNIDREGNVFVDGDIIDEPYITEPALGECNIKLPYQVPDGKYFVMGDHRATSIDSRNLAVGCVGEEQMVGRITFCIWPPDKIRAIDRQ